MATIQVSLPAAIPVFDYGLGLIAVAVGHYATVRVEVGGIGFDGPSAILKGAQAVFREAHIAPSGLWVDADYDSVRLADADTILATAGAAAANVILGTPYTRYDIHKHLITAGFSAPLTAASLFGGFQMASVVEGALLTSELSTPIREIAVIEVEDGQPVKAPQQLDTIGSILAITLGLIQGSPINAPPIKAPPWYTTLRNIALTHELQHISPMGSAAIAFDDYHLATKVERIVESTNNKIDDYVSYDILAINRQGVSISEFGALNLTQPTPYHD